LGVGATKRVKAVRWGVAKNIILGWFITMPAAGLVAAIGFWIVNLAVCRLGFHPGRLLFSPSGV